MDLQCPNGQLTYVAGEGFSTNAFVPVLGGLLQAQGKYPGETRISFSFRVSVRISRLFSSFAHYFESLWDVSRKTRIITFDMIEVGNDLHAYLVWKNSFLLFWLLN